MIRTDSEYEKRSKTFDYAWLFEKIKPVVSGLDTKANSRVSLFMSLKQFPNEANKTYHTIFKSMIETLKIAGGEHILVSPLMIGTELTKATDPRICEERKKFMAICFILRSDPDPDRYTRLLEDLKRSTNPG